MRAMSGIALALAAATASCGDDSPTEPELTKEGLEAAKAPPADSLTAGADSTLVLVPLVSALQPRGPIISTVCRRQQKALRMIVAAQAGDPENADLAAKRSELSAVVDDVCN